MAATCKTMAKPQLRGHHTAPKPLLSSSRGVAQQSLHRHTRCPAYNVDVDSDRQTSQPGTSWGAPPPPPPPPPPPKAPGPLSNLKLPSRRDALVAALGAGLGVGGMFLYYEATAPSDEEIEMMLQEEAMGIINDLVTEYQEQEVAQGQEGGEGAAAAAPSTPAKP